MQEAEGVNFKVGVAGEEGRRRAPPGKQPGFRHNNPNLEDIFRFIERLPVSEDDKRNLANVAKKVPHGALASFRENYAKYIRGEARP